jgi:hypothetical protein
MSAALFHASWHVKWGSRSPLIQGQQGHLHVFSEHNVDIRTELSRHLRDFVYHQKLLYQHTTAHILIIPATVSNFLDIENGYDLRRGPWFQIGSRNSGKSG